MTATNPLSDTSVTAINSKPDTSIASNLHQSDTKVPAKHSEPSSSVTSNPAEPESLARLLESRLVKIEQELKDMSMQLEIIKMYGGMPQPR